MIVKRRCPCCDKRIWWRKTEKTMSFCPHCHISVSFKEKKSNRKPMNIWLALFISIIVSSGIYYLVVYQQDISEFILLYIVLPLVFLYLIITTIKAILFLEYQQGVDTLQEIREDNCDYLAFNYHIKNCPNCQSSRLVDSYWFKRVLNRQQTTNITMVTMDNPSLFVGCLHCQAQYRQQANQQQVKTELKVVIFVIVFLLVIFIFNQQINNIIQWFMSKINVTAMFWSVVFAVNMVSLLTTKSNDKPLSSIELIRLDK